MMTFGEPIGEKFIGRRDAFHVPAIVATCEESVKSGQPVRFTDNTFRKVRPGRKDWHHGVVDPFRGLVEADEPFWVMLSPGTALNLSHYFDVSLDGDDPEPREESVIDLRAKIADLEKKLSRFDGYDESVESGDGCSGCF